MTKSQEPPRRRGRRKVCLIATVHPGRGLSSALQNHLASEVPEVEFTLSARDELDAIWVCGYEPGRERLVRSLRQRHPAAVIVVTGRDPAEAWEAEVRQAGADFAFSWPIAFEVLEAVLRGNSPLRDELLSDPS